MADTAPPPLPEAPPLILTLEMDSGTFARFDALRQRHFPAARNHIPAHATLFHYLPGEDERGILEAGSALARAEAPPEVAVTGVRFTGRGVAYVLESPALAALRGRIAGLFAGRLTAQDAQGWRPHVTVQNKVDPAEARALHAALQAEFVPFRFTAPALLLWRYLGGPWEPRGRLRFGENR
ncbi:MULTISPECIES: 2'-5' RNA ligase family protein [Methylobacterium]|uniref:Phosphoesterase HXTX n=2 Tax=Pseudomonadota TaxID=1224 RepID=A0ABQ4ST33_9HYPH|nr:MULTISPECIES: 2'-5' RNA ligase family protein [Methylobacterium]PIU08151.1 MAG: phosphoesterase HXTX [Methylobacterium sp. CG09_land_8_20_14_0_10_71_15]PIU15661.1 MAG: phosphoesterase HXTX [Methylobacterium sp. CG08_land_8_20_14_0_20_71_15]GBU17285.1 hypothetical protein AwMethylo_15000 [Methylobacterium sp.]GJE06267.1 hypothetical protein AOPFMNJM_1582 [Methylobacterium jeotgali]